MSNFYIIEGVGDEVTITFGILLAVLVVVVSWLSTRVNDSSFAADDILRTTRQTLSDASRNENQPASEHTQENPVPTNQGSDASGDSAREDSVASSTGTTGETHAREDSVTSSTTAETPEGLRQRNVQASPSQPNTLPVESNSSPQQNNLHTLTIRLKYMDETIQTVQASPDETLESFRRRNFTPETQSRYRLIYRGQVLREGSQTLRQLNLATDTAGDESTIPVIHCFLSPTVTPEGANMSASQQMQLVAEELHIGSLLLPILGMCLFCLWYLCIFHTSLFSIQSVVSIVGFTFLYIALIVNHFV